MGSAERLVLKPRSRRGAPHARCHPVLLVGVSDAELAGLKELCLALWLSFSLTLTTPTRVQKETPFADLCEHTTETH